MQAMHATIDGETIELGSQGYDLERTRIFYQPYYELVPGRAAADPVATVQVTCTGRGVGAVPVTDMRMYLEPTVAQVPGEGGDQVFPRPVADLLVRSSPARRSIQIGGDHPLHVELQVRTLVRDQLLGQLEKLHGWVVFHAAAVHLDGAGIAFMGNRNAGKTSSLIALMSTGRYDFLSADRVKLRLSDGYPQMRGMPARCNLHRIALENDPFLRPLAGGRTYDFEGKCLVDVRDLTTLAGVRHVGSADLRLIVLPELSPQHEGLNVTVVRDSAEARRCVAEQLMEGTPVDKHVHWLHYFPDARASLPERLDSVLKQVGRWSA